MHANDAPWPQRPGDSMSPSSQVHVIFNEPLILHLTKQTLLVLDQTFPQSTSPCPQSTNTCPQSTSPCPLMLPHLHTSSQVLQAGKKS